MTEYVWAGYSVYEPVGIFRSYSINLNQRATWNYGGDTLSNGVNLNFWGQFKNFWSSGLGLSFNGRRRSPRGRCAAGRRSGSRRSETSG